MRVRIEVVGIFKSVFLVVALQNFDSSYKISVNGFMVPHALASIFVTR